MSKALQEAARAIFADALQAVDVRVAVRSRIVRQGSMLVLAGKPVALAQIDRVVVVAMGKAAVPMYLATAAALTGVQHEAIVVAPPETLPDSALQAALRAGSGLRATFLRGAHPTPAFASLVAADCIRKTLATVTSRTVVLFLVSGGASAMVEQPLDTTIGLEELAVFSRALVGSGLGITAINTLRKHLSAVKGGRLAMAGAAAKMQCTLLVSDVPHASPDAIASGPSLPDSTTVAETRVLFDTLQRSATLPAALTAWFENSLLPETPKPEDAAFARAHWEVILSSEDLTRATVLAAEARGFRVFVDSTCDDLDYREAGRYLLDRSRALSPGARRRTCLISVGEVGVTLCAQPGEGGRNQQFALWCAESLAATGHTATVLSAGSDGIDGHSSAAGAVCDENTGARAIAAGLSVRAALDGCNAGALLRILDETIHTGPTGNNLRDLRLILTD